MTAERLKVCNELWEHGIKAETLYLDNPKPQKQLEYALESGIPLIIWIGENEISEGVVKIKTLNKHEEFTVARPELVDRVRELI